MHDLFEFNSSPQYDKPVQVIGHYHESEGLYALPFMLEAHGTDHRSGSY
jgi:hypothetical protein